MKPVSVAMKLSAFAVLTGLVFGAAALGGAALDPTDTLPDTGHGAEPGGHGAGADLPSGLAVSQGGYTFVADRSDLAAGVATPFTFRITDERGRAVRDEFELQHEKELHLIVVRRDVSGFQHLHPDRAADGTWSVALRLPEAGAYRAFADFVVDGDKRVLATELFVPGEFRPVPSPAATTSAGVGGFDVSIDASDLHAGSKASLRFGVSRNGKPYDSLEKYLGARGHLVALREGDLAYLHVHPVETRQGDVITFGATFPTAGRYRLFLQFQTGGEVHTVSYAVEVAR